LILCVLVVSADFGPSFVLLKETRKDLNR